MLLLPIMSVPLFFYYTKVKTPSDMRLKVIFLFQTPSFCLLCVGSDFTSVHYYQQLHPPPMASTSTTLLLSVALLQILVFVSPISSFSSESDLLLSFKASIEDRSSSLSTWTTTSSSSSPCSWAGITCAGVSPFSVTSINLQTMNLSGEISPSICSLRSLTYLNLADNFFKQPIPLRLFKCSSLQTLNLSNNLIWGTIPDQISVFRTLTVLDLSQNHLEGNIPDAIGSLRKLRVLNLGSNLLSGAVPPVFANFTDLTVLDLSQNPYLMSEIPIEIAALENLEQVFLQRSGFYGQIPASLVKLQKLSILDLSRNNLTGGFPHDNLSESLVSFDVSENRLSGSLPAGICSSRLISLSLHTNRFNGSLPRSIAKCLSLEKFQVQNNDFSGEVLLWSLPKIKILRAENNRFSGEIPDSISTSLQLEEVQIDNNTFTGRIPRGLGLVKTLYRFSASMNDLSGEIPPNFCDSPDMSIINLSHNALVGPIPEMIKCKKLVSLSLSNNSLAGEIPSSLSELPVLTYLDLSANNLSGSIPEELQNLKLALFNVSFNQLSGPVPMPLISGLPASFLDGNPGLCGPGLSKSCSGNLRSHYNGLNTLACVLISVGFGVGILMVAGCFLAYHKSLMQRSQGVVWRSVFFYSLRVTEQELIARMDDKTAVGSGSAFGQVYVLRVPSGELIVVKKLVNFRNHSPKTLKSDIKTLAKTRHRNIAKILGYCHSDESIFIIYENLPGGSLSGLIQSADLDLDWKARVRIAVGVAQGLEYLHKDYVPCLLHRNVKSSNIVLDGDFVPKLTDFGLDRVLGEVAFQTTVASKSSSSCYVSPESGYSKKATSQMDVYSFGVVLLELLTGRQAEQVDSSTIDIVKWVRRKINITNGVFEILDSRISEATHRHEMMVALELALKCTSVMPEKRPSMSQVATGLQSLGSSVSAKNKITSSFLGGDIVS